MSDQARTREWAACPKCGGPDLSIYKYDHGWKHVECNARGCDYMGPGEGSVAAAIKAHNDRAEDMAHGQ